MLANGCGVVADVDYAPGTGGGSSFAADAGACCAACAAQEPEACWAAVFSGDGACWFKTYEQTKMRASQAGVKACWPNGRVPGGPGPAPLSPAVAAAVAVAAPPPDAAAADARRAAALLQVQSAALAAAQALRLPPATTKGAAEGAWSEAAAASTWGAEAAEEAAFSIQGDEASYAPPAAGGAAGEAAAGVPGWSSSSPAQQAAAEAAKAAGAAAPASARGERVPRAQRSYRTLPLPRAFAERWAAYAAMHSAYSDRGLKRGLWSADSDAAILAGDAALGARRAAAEALAAPCRGAIVVMPPLGDLGLGNRVMAMVSGALLGLLTRRAVYAHFSASYFATMADMFAPAAIPWDADVEGIPPPGFGFGSSSSGGSRAGDVVRIGLNDASRQDLLEELACGPLSAFVADGATLEVVSGQYFAPLLQFNAEYAATLDALFPDGDVFGPLARALFAPSAPVADIVEAFQREHGWAERYVVGMQVRTGGDFTQRGFQQADWDVLLRCGAALLPAGLAAREDATAFFVATDIDWAREQASAQLARLERTPVWQLGDAWVRSNDARGCQVAFADALLLSEANDVVTTAWSTFGYLAAGLTGRGEGAGAGPAMLTQLRPADAVPGLRAEVLGGRPATFMGVPMHADARTGCARLPTSQPCFHFLPGQRVHELSCFGGDAGWARLEREMRGGRYC